MRQRRADSEPGGTMRARRADTLLSAASDAESELPLAEGVRLPLAKRALLRMTRFVAEPQPAPNPGTDHALAGLRTSIDELHALIEDTRAAATRRMDDQDRRIDRVDSAIDDVRAAVSSPRENQPESMSQLQAAIDELRATSLNLVGHQERVLADLRSDFVDLQLALAAGETTIALAQGQLFGVNDQVKGLEDRMNGLHGAITSVREEQVAQRQRERARQSLVDLFLREVRRSYPAPPDIGRLTAIPGLGDDLYQALEDAFRGSFEDVRERLRVYLADVGALAPPGRVLDLGTGRGEWLGLLVEAEIDGYGVDTNAEAVERCRQRGLDVVHADAVQHLATVPEASLAAITGFHFAEHISFDGLIDVVDHAMRALRPGGLLILETPNPMNVVVGAATFYLDPSHERPLHPLLMEFLLSARGYGDVELRYLHPSSSPLRWSPELGDVFGDAIMKTVEPMMTRLNDILFGPQDFAILGRRLRD